MDQSFLHKQIVTNSGLLSEAADVPPTAPSPLGCAIAD
jgi:hypothetical protein